MTRRVRQEMYGGLEKSHGNYVTKATVAAYMTSLTPDKDDKSSVSEIVDVIRGAEQIFFS